MILDYVASTGYFTLRVARGEADPATLMKEAGLDLSTARSTSNEAVLMTQEPYAAVAFAAYGTLAAKAQLNGIIDDIKQSWKSETSVRIKCPADKELWPFQRAGVAYALHRRNTLLGDQPGLGKTAQAICFANEIAARRILIVCPANIRIQWVRFIREWSTFQWPNQTIYPILKGAHGVSPTANWTIVSYDLARTEAIGKALAQGRYDLLILDEAHYVKTSDSGRTRAIFGGGKTRTFAPMAERSERVLALTGTPLPNRPREAYTLARGLCFDAVDWMSEDRFKSKFNPSALLTGQRADGSEYKYVREEVGRTSELQARLRANFMVRRLKRDVLTQLDLPEYDIIHLDEKTEPVKQALKAESLLQIDPDNLEGCDAEIMGQIAVVRHMMGVAMAPQVAKYLGMLVDGGEEKIVVFAWHIAVLDILEAALQKHGCVRVDGGLTAKGKQSRIDAFIENPKIKFCLGNIQSIGTGTDGLQKVSSHCLFAESSWVPGENEQAVDRLDRGGQKFTVQADFFTVPGSLSDRILASSLRKRRTTHKALDARY